MAGEAHAAVLQQSLRDIHNSWQAGGEQWRDQARIAFEKEHLEPLCMAVEDAVRGIDELESIIRSVQRECREPR